MAYSNENRGVLYRNERKRDDKDPSHTGQCEVNGVPMWISAWIQEAGPQAKNPGQKFFSLKFRAKDSPAGAPNPPRSQQQPAPSRAPAPAQKAEPAPAEARAAQKAATDDLDEDLPF